MSDFPLTKLEICMLERVDENLKSRYIVIRDHLKSNYYKYINNITSELTDHSFYHIASVLDCAYFLLGGERTSSDNLTTELKEIEYYILCLSILFHDVCMINGREGHASLAESFRIYKTIPNGDHEEGYVIANIVAAHSGEDRIRNYNPTEPVHNVHVRLQIIAAIVRFSDEIAINQRTSPEFINKKRLNKESLKHHFFSSNAKCTVDYVNRRICLTINIILNKQKRVVISDKKTLDLNDVLEFVGYSLTKLNYERMYASFYANVIAINQLDVSITFDTPKEIIPKNFVITNLPEKIEKNSVIDKELKNYYKEISEL